LIEICVLRNYDLGWQPRPPDPALTSLEKGPTWDLMNSLRTADGFSELRHHSRAQELPANLVPQILFEDQQIEEVERQRIFPARLALQQIE
jgi:hypothetical protein